MPESRKRRLEWALPARDAYEASIARIADEDPGTADLVAARVARSLDLIRSQPGIGTPAPVAGRKVYAIPATGHSVNYRVTAHAIVILRWYRQRQNVRR